MDELATASFAEIDKIADKPIVLFGSGNIAKKTLRNIEAESVEFIADNSKNLQGETYKGFPIRSPEEITSDHFVIITSTAIVDIAEQLKAYELTPQDDFVVSPTLNDRIAINELENIETEFYFTSGAVSGTEKLGSTGTTSTGVGCSNAS